MRQLAAADFVDSWELSLVCCDGALKRARIPTETMAKMEQQQQALMLKGYRVLDFTHFVAGPTCTRILAELGADVIKVERSLEGDHVRTMGIVKDGTSTYYFQHSHSKRSLGIDLHQARAKELILGMIPKIDMVVENFAPGV